MNTCKYIKENGQPCKTRPLKDDEFCFFHSEKTKTQRQEAVKRGGDSIKRSYGRDDEIRLTCVDDVLKLLEQTANDLRQNKINNKSAAILNFIANTTLKAIEAKFVEKGRVASPRKQKYDEETEKILYPLDEDIEEE